MSLMVFDFDGTLVNSFPTWIALFNRYAKTYGYQRLDEAELPKLRHLTAREMLLKMQINWRKYPRVIRQVRQDYRNEVMKLKPIDGLAEALNSIKRLGCKIGVVTHHGIDKVLMYAEANGFPMFDFVQQEKRVFGRGRVIKQLLKKYEVRPNDAYYIGDEQKDISAARQCTVHAIGVSWGHCDPEVLEAVSPERILKAPSELLELIEVKSQETKRSQSPPLAL